MASAAAVAALLALVAGLAADHRALLPDLLVRIALLLGGVNLAGAALIFAPIRRFLAGDLHYRDAATRRIRALPALSGLCVAVLAAAVMLGHSAVVHSSWDAFLRSPPQLLIGTTQRIRRLPGFVRLFPGG